MQELVSDRIGCPYCGEIIEVLVDCSVEEQEYIEDCQVCCCPIVFQVSVYGDDKPLIHVRAEND